MRAPEPKAELTRALRGCAIQVDVFHIGRKCVDLRVALEHELQVDGYPTARRRSILEPDVAKQSTVLIDFAHIALEDHVAAFDESRSMMIVSPSTTRTTCARSVGPVGAMSNPAAIGLELAGAEQPATAATTHTATHTKYKRAEGVPAIGVVG